MAGASKHLLQELLRDVSRSFYTTLRVLPSAIRPQVGLAYLLARTSDTIADTALVAPGDRLQALEALRERIRGARQEPLNFRELADRQGTAAERMLLEQSEGSTALLDNFDAADRQLVQWVLDIIIGGQELDLRRFNGASAGNVMALHNETELDDYTYRVAGCVGEFWTKICRAHLFPAEPLDDQAMLQNGVRFGKGLQLVNILRDLPADLRQGRCYLPAERLAQRGLSPADLLDPSKEMLLRPLYDLWIEQARQHLRAGWTYTLTLPRRCWRVRLACAWPLLIGRDTLSLLRTRNVLEPEPRIKISRRRVRRIMLQSLLFYPSPAHWKRLF